MKRLLLSLTASLFLLGSYAQNCETTPSSTVRVKTQDGTHMPTGEAIWVCEDITLDIVGESTTAFIEKVVLLRLQVTIRTIST